MSKISVAKFSQTGFGWDVYILRCYVSKKVDLISQNSDCTRFSNVLTSYPALVISIAGEAKLWDHDIGVAERHAPVDVCQLVEAVRALQHVLRSVPHAHIPAAGFLLQIPHVYGLHEHPEGRWSPDACERWRATTKFMAMSSQFCVWSTRAWTSPGCSWNSCRKRRWKNAAPTRIIEYLQEPQNDI